MLLDYVANTHTPQALPSSTALRMWPVCWIVWMAQCAASGASLVMIPSPLSLYPTQFSY